MADVQVHADLLRQVDRLSHRRSLADRGPRTRKRTHGCSVVRSEPSERRADNRIVLGVDHRDAADVGDRAERVVQRPRVGTLAE